MGDSIPDGIMIQGDRRIAPIASVLARPGASQPHQAFIPKATWGTRVDARRVLNGIIHVICNGLRWPALPATGRMIPHWRMIGRQIIMTVLQHFA